MEYSAGVFKVYDKIADSIRSKLNPDRLLKIEFKIHNSQHFLGLAITALGLILSAVIAIKTDKLSVLLIGLAWTIGFPILFWSNLKMIKQTQLLSLRYRSNISDPSYLEILTVFYLFGAIFCIAASLYFAVALSSIKILISGLVICISILVTMTFITRYELLGIEQEPTTTIWENAICILSIPLRIISRLAGLAFAFSNILLVAGLSYFIYLIVSGLGSLDFSQIFTGLSMVVGGLTSAVYLSSPLLIYLIALSLYLLVRLLAQLSGIPGTHIDGKSDLGSKEVHLHFMSKGEDQTVVMSGVDARNLYLSGTLDPGTLVWMDGMQEWQPASEIGF